MKKPIELVVDALSSRARKDPSGAFSLSHVLVVVPTAQSGRRLRMALARRFSSGILPPLVCEPSRLLLPEDDSVAGRTDEIAAFYEALGDKASIDIAAQLSDIRRTLGAKALLFRDIADSVGEKLNGEAAYSEEERWRNLAEIEERYLAALARRAKKDRIETLKKTISFPPPLAEIEEIVLACLYDPPPVFAEYLAATKLPVSEISLPFETLTLPRVVQCATGLSESERIAEIFSGVSDDEELPSLCVADADSFAEIEGALKIRGFKVHNPSGTYLIESSLGHLVSQIVALSHSRSYAVFSAFIRGGDTRRWLCSRLDISADEFTKALVQLDNAQAKLLPEKIDQIGPKTTGRLREIFEFIFSVLRKQSLREILRAIFKDRLLDGKDQDAREFAAAAAALGDIIDECEASSLPEKAAHELFLRRLKEQTYSLEPDEGDVIMTDGWLELPFVEADEIIIAGFNEGCVPENVTAHPFLPDSLRRAFGLSNNETRAARDRRILSCAVSCRSEGAVTAFFRSIDSKGDVLKPSRLLFEGLDDKTLIERVLSYYSVSAGTSESPASDFPEAWRLDPGIPPEETKLEFSSPSSIDMYLHCPFNYCLKKTFGERSDDRAEELDPSEFGNLIHDALERWGSGANKDSEDAAAISDELSEHVDALLAERFGADIPAIVSLQAESAKRRLEAFSSAQVAWHSEGWRIESVERRMQVQYGHTLIKGRCDRIDYNVNTKEWCVIDYKTFDSIEKAQVRDNKGNWLSLQLPLYCSMLDADEINYPDARRENIFSSYCILGKDDSSTLFAPAPAFPGSAVAEAEKKIREIIDDIEHGIFWPPSKQEWSYNYKDWISQTPEQSLSPEWIADQLRRIEEREKRRASK